MGVAFGAWVGSKLFFSRPEHPPTDIPRNATDTDNYAWCVAKLVYSVASYS